METTHVLRPLPLGIWLTLFCLIGLPCRCSAQQFNSQSELLRDARIADASDAKPPQEKPAYPSEAQARDSDTSSDSYTTAVDRLDSNIVPRSGYYATRPYRDASLQDGYRPDYEAHGTYRQPTSITAIDESTVVISTSRTGQLFEFGITDESVALIYDDEQAAWGDVVTLSSNCIAVAEQNRSQIVVFAKHDGVWSPKQTLASPGQANCLYWDAENGTLLASGKWSQRLYRWKLDSAAPTAFGSREFVDLPMCGGQVLPLHQSGCILVVDAFGREYAIVDALRFDVRHTGQLYGHNVTGLAASADEEFVYFPHQLLNEYARTVVTDITWGGLMSNNIRWLRTERLLTRTGIEVFKTGRFYPLGASGNGAGDPSSMAVSSNGLVAVTLAGTNRVSIGKDGDYYFHQVDVGMRPIDCVFSADASRLVVVNQFSDSLSIIDVTTLPAANDRSAIELPVRHVPLGKVRSPTEIELGEHAFFNSRLSHDGWMSCHSCHSQGHTNGQLNDNMSDLSFGTPKRVMSLLGQAETLPYAWNGLVESLEEQVENSIRSTMASDHVPDTSTVQAIAAYVRSLPAPPSLRHARLETPAWSKPTLKTVAHYARAPLVPEVVQSGKALFRALNCVDCHAGATLTSQASYDVGLYDEDNLREFNPPSLIAVSQRQTALFHHGQTTSLQELIATGQHQMPRQLSTSEQQALIAYLESL